MSRLDQAQEGHGGLRHETGGSEACSDHPRSRRVCTFCAVCGGHGTASRDARPGQRAVRHRAGRRPRHHAAAADAGGHHDTGPERSRRAGGAGTTGRHAGAGRHDDDVRRRARGALPPGAVVHVEAGLRTFDRYSPFPEEMNRRLTSQLTTLHLAPTPASCANLVGEGIERQNIVVTGNSVIDALLWTVGKRIAYDDPALEKLDVDERRVLLVTAHRRESWGEPMAGVGRALGRLARSEPDLLVVLPVHRNPTVREALLPALEGLSNVLVTEPLGYGGFARLIDRAHGVLTDSGGVQEEAPSLGKPVLVMRKNTERPEAVTAGTARLVGTDEERIVSEVRTLLHDEAAHATMANAVNPYGDGRAAPRSVAALEHLFGLGGRPTEFQGEKLSPLTMTGG